MGDILMVYVRERVLPLNKQQLLGKYAATVRALRTSEDVNQYLHALKAEEALAVQTFFAEGSCPQNQRGCYVESPDGRACAIAVEMHCIFAYQGSACGFFYRYTGEIAHCFQIHGQIWRIART